MGRIALGGLFALEHQRGQHVIHQSLGLHHGFTRQPATGDITNHIHRSRIGLQLLVLQQRELFEFADIVGLEQNFHAEILCCGYPPHRREHRREAALTDAAGQLQFHERASLIRAPPFNAGLVKDLNPFGFQITQQGITHRAIKHRQEVIALATRCNAHLNAHLGKDRGVLQGNDSGALDKQAAGFAAQ